MLSIILNFCPYNNKPGFTQLAAKGLGKNKQCLFLSGCARISKISISFSKSLKIFLSYSSHNHSDSSIISNNQNHGEIHHNDSPPDPPPPLEGHRGGGRTFWALGGVA